MMTIVASIATLVFASWTLQLVDRAIFGPGLFGWSIVVHAGLLAAAALAASILFGWRYRIARRR